MRRLIVWNPPPFLTGDLPEENAISDLEDLGELVAEAFPDRIVMLLEEES